jgi:hypothetical protein
MYFEIADLSGHATCKSILGAKFIQLDPDCVLGQASGKLAGIR